MLGTWEGVTAGDGGSRVEGGRTTLTTLRPPPGVRPDLLRKERQEIGAGLRDVSSFFLYHPRHLRCGTRTWTEVPSTPSGEPAGDSSVPRELGKGLGEVLSYFLRHWTHN